MILKLPEHQARVATRYANWVELEERRESPDGDSHDWLAAAHGLFAYNTAVGELLEAYPDSEYAGMDAPAPRLDAIDKREYELAMQGYYLQWEVVE